MPTPFPELPLLDTINVADLMPPSDDTANNEDFPDYLDATTIDAAIQPLESPDLADTDNNSVPSVDDLFPGITIFFPGITTIYLYT